MSNFTRILVLDDDLNRQKAFKQALIGTILEQVYTAKEAIQKLKDHPFDAVFLDHDLGGKTMVASGEGTGFEVAKWLYDNPDRMPKQIIIHSFNPVGAQCMKALLPSAQVCPGAWAMVGKATFSKGNVEK